MYVILTSKPGQFRTEVVGGLRPLEAYDYLFYGHTKAHFVIAELLNESTRIRVIEDDTAIALGEDVAVQTERGANTFARGDRVFHMKFGYGAVTAVEGNKLTVAFEKAGEKKVIDSFVEKQ